MSILKSVKTKPYQLVLAMTTVAMLSACQEQSPKTNDSNAQATTQATSQTTTNEQAQPSTSQDNTNTGQAQLTTATGVVDIAKNPSPLVVYDMTAMQNLAVLGVAVQGMPDIEPDRLAKFHLKAEGTPEAAVVGTLFEPNLESLNALQPKAIFVGSRMAEKSEEIAKIAPVYNLTIDTKNVYESSKKQLAEFGVIFGKEKEATQAQNQIDTAIETTKKAVAGKGNGLAILVNGNKLSAYGQNSRYGFLHTTFGIPMADEHIEDARHGQPISFEYLQKTDPDWLFVLDRGAAIGEEGQSAKEVLNNPLMHTTKAYKNNQIVYLSADSYLAFGGYYQWLADAKIITDAFNQKQAQ